MFLGVKLLLFLAHCNRSPAGAGVAVHLRIPGTQNLSQCLAQLAFKYLMINGERRNSRSGFLKRKHASSNMRVLKRGLGKSC